MTQNEKILHQYLKVSAYGNKIYIGMGAGSISAWMKNFQSYIK